jgi:hypothetical protein
MQGRSKKRFVVELYSYPMAWQEQTSLQSANDLIRALVFQIRQIRVGY